MVCSAVKIDSVVDEANLESIHFKEFVPEQVILSVEFNHK